MSDAPAPSAPAAPSSSPSTSAPSVSPQGPKATSSPGGDKGASSNPSAPVKSASTLPHGGNDSADAPTNAHPAAESGETKAETVQRLKLKTKINGREEEKEYTHEELALHIQKGQAAHEKFETAANTQKTFQNFIKAVKENPFEAFKDPAFGDLGANFKQLVIDHLAEEFKGEELKAKDPREFELNQLRTEKAKWEAKQKAEVETRQAAAQKEADDRMWTETKKTWVSALEQGGFGENPALIRNMAEIGQEFLDAGIDLDPKLLVAELKNRISGQQKMVYSGLKGEQLVNALGEDVVNELLTYKVEQARKGRVVQDPIKAPDPVPGGNSVDKDTENPKPTASLRSYAEFLRSK